MTFILKNDGRDSDAVLAFKRYRDYINKNKSSFSPATLELALSDWFYNFQDPKSPHDSWLEQLSIVEPSEGNRNEIRKTKIQIKLLNAYHNGYITLKYKNVNSFKIDAINVKSGHCNWRYDEFRISKNGLLLHEIEWSSYSDTATWLIEAEDIDFSWIKNED